MPQVKFKWLRFLVRLKRVTKTTCGVIVIILKLFTFGNLFSDRVSKKYNPKRKMVLSLLPTLKKVKTSSKKNNDDILKSIYSEVNSNYRNLADIRFKLLGLVPAVSILAWVSLLKDLNLCNVSHAIFGLLSSILAIRVTYGVRTYDLRNDELYDDLISRGRKIEDELGVDTAIFKGRLEANNVDRIHESINHGRGLEFIYSSVFFGWGLLVIWFAVNILKHFYVCRP